MVQVARPSPHHKLDMEIWTLLVLFYVTTVLNDEKQTKTQVIFNENMALV